MIKKLYDTVIAIMSAVGTAFVLTDMLVAPVMRLFGIEDEWSSSPMLDVIRLFLGMVLVGVVMLYVKVVRRRHTNLYDLQYTMAMNNKLHPLRALAVITYDCEKCKNNKLNIGKATFSYNLIKKDVPLKSLDVGYKIKLRLKRNCWQRITDSVRRFRLYVISEHDAELKKLSLIVDGVRQVPNISSCTSRGIGGDVIRRFSGLKEIEIILSENIDWKTEIVLELEYLIEDQIKELDPQYGFAIIPKNYSKRIRNVEVELFANGIAIKNLHCQRVGINGVLETIATFEGIDSTSSSYKTTFKPDMNSVYFVQFDLPTV